MNIDGRDLIQRLEELYALGQSPDGSHTRLAFSREDAKARERFRQYFAEIGIETRQDDAGNLIARLEGCIPNAPAILTGSHLDTVPDGGKYDGALGCMAGWAVCNALRKSGRTLHHPLEVIVFADEEGARFGNGMFGSNAFCGTLTGLGAGDVDVLGMERDQVLADFGVSLPQVLGAKREKDTVQCFVELHIEQGASLYRRGVSIGVVSAIAGVRRWDVDVTGEANHAGSTRMTDRCDALVAAAACIAQIPRLAERLGGEYTVGTVGCIRALPGSVNVIPGRCGFSLELRDQSEEVLDALQGAVAAELERVCAQTGCRFALRPVLSQPPAPMAAWVQQAIRAACQKLGINPATVPSGAFHDAMAMSRRFPTGMIFIPSVDGISHSPQEHSTLADIETGCHVLLESVLQLDAM